MNKIKDVLKIRKVKLADAPQVLELYREVTLDSEWLLTQHFELPKTVAKEREFISHHFSGKNSHLAMAMIGHEIIGIAGLTGGARKRNSHVAELGISVRKKYRGQGVGGVLIKYLLDWARKHKLFRIQLSVYEDNKSAVKLYKRMGFKKEGAFKCAAKVGGRYCNSIEMATFLK